MSLFHINLTIFVETIGYAGLFAIVFAESGLFFGFFFPGDSLLFSAGLLASQGIFNVWQLGILLALAAILGDSVGYWFGKKVGPAIFSREDGRFFHKRHIERTKTFYEKYGSRTILLARFVPIVRTFAPILAGVGSMPYKKFLSYNIVGGILWSFALIFVGYFLGIFVPGAESYVTLIAIVIIIISFLPILKEMRNQKK
jgi:membrane-associated protein